jgi:hypothetical protein
MDRVVAELASHWWAASGALRSAARPLASVVPSGWLRAELRLAALAMRQELVRHDPVANLSFWYASYIRYLYQLIMSVVITIP